MQQKTSKRKSIMDRWQQMLSPRIFAYSTTESHQDAAAMPCVEPEVTTVVDSLGANFNHITTPSNAHSSLNEDSAQNQPSEDVMSPMMNIADRFKPGYASLHQRSQKTSEQSLNAPSMDVRLSGSATLMSTPSSSTTTPATTSRLGIGNCESQVMAPWGQPMSISSSCSSLANSPAGNDFIRPLQSRSSLSENANRGTEINTSINTLNSIQRNKDMVVSAPTTVQSLSSALGNVGRPVSVHASGEAPSTQQMNNDITTSIPTAAQPSSGMTLMADRPSSTNQVTSTTSLNCNQVDDSVPTMQDDIISTSLSASIPDSTIVAPAFKPTFGRCGFHWQTRDKDLLWYLRHTKGWTKEQVHALNRFPTSMNAMQTYYRNLVKSGYNPQQKYFAPVEYAALDLAEYRANMAQAKRMQRKDLSGADLGQSIGKTTPKRSRGGRSGRSGRTGRGRKVSKLKNKVHWRTKRAQEKRAKGTSSIQVIQDFWTPQKQDLLIFLIEILDWPYEKIMRTNRFCVPKEELVAKYRHLVINQYVPTQDHFSEEEYATIEGQGDASNFVEEDSIRRVSLVNGMKLRARSNVDPVQETMLDQDPSPVDETPLCSGTPTEQVEETGSRGTGPHFWQASEKDLLLFLKDRKALSFHEIEDLKIFPTTMNGIKTQYYVLVRKGYKPRRTHFEEKEYLPATSQSNPAPLTLVERTRSVARPAVHPVEPVEKTTKSSAQHRWLTKEKDVLMFLAKKEGMSFEDIHDLEMFPMSLSALSTQYYLLKRTNYQPRQIHFEKEEYLSARELLTDVDKSRGGRPRKSLPVESSTSHVKAKPVTPAKRRLDPVVKEAAMSAARDPTMSRETRTKSPRVQSASSAEATNDFDQLMQQHIGKIWDNAIASLHKSMEGLVQIDPDSDHELNSQFLLIKIKNRAFGALKTHLQS